MVMSCSALGCRNRFTKKSKQVHGQLSFHKFPSNNPMYPEKVALRQLWHIACKRPNWIAPKRAVLCSQHFLPTDFYRFGMNIVKLKDNVVPSIFKTQGNIVQRSRKPTKLQHPESESNRIIHNPSTNPGVSLDLSYSATLNSISQPFNFAQTTRHPNLGVLTNSGDLSEESQNMPRSISFLNSPASDLISNHSYFTFAPSMIETELSKSKLLSSQFKSPSSFVSDEVERYKLQLEEARKKIKSLSEKVRRQDARLKSYDHHANELQCEAQDAAETLSQNLPSSTSQLLKRLALKSDVNNEESAYHEDLKSFAITMYAMSPRAYEFLRDSFSKALPSTSRIRQWKYESSLTQISTDQTSSILHDPHSGLYVMEQRAAVENLLGEI